MTRSACSLVLLFITSSVACAEGSSSDSSLSGLGTQSTDTMDGSADDGGTDDGGTDDGGTADESTDDGDTTGVEPSGAGPNPTVDPEGDVDKASADVLATAIYTDGTYYDLRISYADTPFDPDTLDLTTWCLNLPAVQGSAPGCGGGNLSIELSRLDDGVLGHFKVIANGAMIDSCVYASYEDASHTVRLLLPADDFPIAGTLEHWLDSGYAGGGADRDYVPDEGTAESHEVEVLPEFMGEAACY